MGRKKIHDYEQTAFARRICELQKQNNYTDQDVMNGVVDESGNTLINDAQVYGSYKSGKRKNPRDFPILLQAFAKFYDVTTDYLLELDDYPKPQIKSVHDATGLSVNAVKNLMAFHKDFPFLMKMIDTLLSSSKGEDIAFLVNLYNQILSDYKDNKDGNTTSSYDMEKIQQRILRTQQAYNYMSSIIQSNMAEYLDDEIAAREYENDYYHSEEFINANSFIPNDDSTGS